ncbi:MAG: hypothetical protein GY751_26155 [Bacteroidetes bacterium]|nr:hypothetical protein [Bacteroidota bacterium]
MDALVTASFLLVGWNTYSAIIVAKDTYTGKMPGPKSIGYSIAGLAGLTAFMLYTYGIAAEKHPELLEAEGDGEIYYEGGRMVSIEENTTVNYSWRTSPDDIEVDEWDIGSKVEERVQEEMYDGDSNRGYWTYRDDDDNEITVEYEWDKIVDEGEEEYIKSWAETDESFNADTFHSFRNTRKTRRPFATARINPMPKIDEEVACMNCLWGGKDTELVSLTDEYGAFKGCPNCHSDNLIDLTREQKYAEDREESERMTRPEAEALADKVEKLVAPYTDRVEVCGSYRRGSPRPGDLDVVIIPKKGVTLPEMVKAIKPSAVNWIGEKKTQVVIDGRKVDFRVSSPKGWGAALLYFTGPAGYNIGMRVRAKKQGMKLNEYGIFDRSSDKYLGGATEDEIYKVLGKTPKAPELRAEGEVVEMKCVQCGSLGETFTFSGRHFCGPVCRYKWEDKSRLAAEGRIPGYTECPSCHEWQPMSDEDEVCDDCEYCEYCEEYHPEEIRRICYEEAYSKHYEGPAEVFEAPRATYTDPAQQSFEKSYHIRAKKPLNKIVKTSLGGKLPSDDSRQYYYGSSTTQLTDVTAADYKLLQGYLTIQNMAQSRFRLTNTGWADTTHYPRLTATNVIPKSVEQGGYLSEAVKHYHGLAACGTDQEKIDYMNNEKMADRHFEEMLAFLRYHDITTTGPYTGITMVATDRAPYETGGGYGNVYYNSRNPYGSNPYPLKEFGSYDKTKKTMQLSDRRASRTFTRLTKLRPYTTFPQITQDDNAYVEYSTDGGYGWRSSGSQSFRLTSFICPESSRVDQRNPDPGYASRQDRKGWRYDTKGWEGVKSAPYRYATLVYLPTQESLQEAHGSQGVLSRQTLVDLYNLTNKLWKKAQTQAAAKQKRLKEKLEKADDLKRKNKALTNLENATNSMQETLKVLVQHARNAGVDEDDIYDALEHTLYDIEEMVEDWEPSDYWDAESSSEWSCSCEEGEDCEDTCSVCLQCGTRTITAGTPFADEYYWPNREKRVKAAKGKYNWYARKGCDYCGEWLPEEAGYTATNGVFIPRIEMKPFVRDAEDAKKAYGCKVCGNGPLPATVLNDKVFVLCPTCGLGEGSEDATGWNVTWTEDTPKVMHNRPFADVEWDTPSEG